MLVPSDMISAQSKMVYQMNKYFGERVQLRKAGILKTIQEVCRIVQDVLKEVEVQEPRFISSLNDYNGRYDGLEVISPNEFEIIIYLNQMGVLNFVDDGTLPGCAVLKLSDGRKRSMSLWVEFITASGYLSARKIRSRFQTLVAQAVDKCAYRDIVKMIADTTEVKLRIRERIIVQITPAFKCAGCMCPFEYINIYRLHVMNTGLKSNEIVVFYNYSVAPISQSLANPIDSMAASKFGD